jgi:hypothetical protein
MNKKIKKGLAIAAVALQVPMLALWKIVYDSARITCHALTVMDGGFVLKFDISRLLPTLLTYLPLILPLAACMVLSIWGLVRVLKGNGLTPATLCLYGGVAVACQILVFMFANTLLLGNFGQWTYHLFGIDAIYVHSLLTCEFTFYRYPFGFEPSYSLIDVWEYVSLIKYVLLEGLAAVSAILCIGGIAELCGKKGAH